MQNLNVKNLYKSILRWPIRLVSNELLSARCDGWRATSEYRLKSAISLQRGPVDPKFQVEGVAPINHSSSSQKTKLNDLSYNTKIWTLILVITDKHLRETENRHTDTSVQYKVCDFQEAVIVKS